MTETRCEILIGDVRAKLRELRDRIATVVSQSPIRRRSDDAAWALRFAGQVWGGRDDCAHEWTDAFCAACGAWRGELGLEPTLALFLEHTRDVFRLVREVMTDDGTLWLNMGDCYATKPQHAKGAAVKVKDIVGQHWRVAFALQEDGWFFRADIIWHKPNPTPEPVRDRPTKVHEYIFIFSKRSRYFYDAAAIRESVSGTANPRGSGVNPKAAKMPTPSSWAIGPGAHDRIAHNRGPRPRQNASFSHAVRGLVDKRNARTVWTIPTEPFPGAHYATFPTALARRCILAGTKPGDVVLDPFGGSGTTGAVACSLGRNAVLIDLNPANEALMRSRLLKPLLERKTKKPRKCDTLELPLKLTAYTTENPANVEISHARERTKET